MLPVFEILPTRSKSTATLNCLYSAVSLSCFTFCLSCEFDVDCLFVELGVANIVPSAVVFEVL